MMKPIQETLTKWLNDNETFKERHAAMKQEILTEPTIVAFLNAHPEITDDHVERRLNKLYEYVSQSIQCNKCANLENCCNILAGHSPVLVFLNGEIQVTYEKCKNSLATQQMAYQQRLVQSLYVPREILGASMDNLVVDAGRVQAIKEIDAFLSEVKTGLPEKGLFLTGPFGVGKTYLLGAIANELQKTNTSSMLVYMPELVRFMGDAIRTNTVTEKINMFKKADVLMIDDIGAENFSAWFRDEVLGAIVQHRMMEGLPTFFTSNYTMDQLEEVLAVSSKGQVEKIKAGRIMERIRQVSKEVVMTGKNRRQ